MNRHFIKNLNVIPSHSHVPTDKKQFWKLLHLENYVIFRGNQFITYLLTGLKFV